MKTIAPKFAEHARSRNANAEQICANAEEFKVCTVCLSIAFQRAGTCPICRSYRWYYSAEAVRLVARIMQQSPFPFTAGTVPRFIVEPPTGFEPDGTPALN
jgi:hypothetical protein